LAISRLRLERINPFRLIGIFPASRKIVEWRWNLKQLARKELPWETRQWVSSGFDEPKAQRVRGYTFRLAKLQRSLAGLDWLRRLHRSHAPRTGPFSTCMHRADAATVAYTEIAVSSRQAILRYCAGAPCQNPTRSVHRLRLRAG
jgi:hypothetical protein